MGSAMGAEQSFTTAGSVVTDVIGGADSVKIQVAAEKYVSLNGANTYSGGTEIVSGGVIVSNLTALGTGDIVCRSGTAIRVDVSYGADFKTKIIDRIKVVNADGSEVTEASGEPWVAIRLFGEGVKNDVDFSEQPYLWVSGDPAKDSSTSDALQNFVPWNNEYHFGYAGTLGASWKTQGMYPAKLTDGPNGESRKLIVRGKMSLPMSSTFKHTFTGGVVVEQGAEIWVSDDNGFGAIPTEVSPQHVILRDNARIVTKTQGFSLHANIGIYVDGSGRFHMTGSSRDILGIINGPLGGHGTFTSTDQGGLWFKSNANTFTGELVDANSYYGSDGSSYHVDFVIGDGENFSWSGSKIKATNANAINSFLHRIVLNCDRDVEFDATLEGYGPIVKRGIGTITMKQPIPLRTYNNGNVVSNKVVLSVEAGTLKLTGSASMAQTGIANISAGATLDLNHVPFTSTWLFVGGGIVTNLYNDEVNCIGMIQDEALFNGYVAGAMHVGNYGTNAYVIGENFQEYDNQFAGDVVVDHGDVRIAGRYNNVNDLVVGTSGNVEFAGMKRVHGLKLEIKKGHSPKKAEFEVGSDAVDVLLDEGADLTTDMSAFAGGTWTTGANNDSEGASAGVFAKILGSTLNGFVARFTGLFIAEKDGVYKFRMAADDYAVLWINGTRVVEALHATAGTQSSGQITLAKGYHEIRLLFGENTGREVLQVEVQRPDDAGYAMMPIDLLTTYKDVEPPTVDLKGNGDVSFAEDYAGGQTIDFSAFEGDIRTGGDVSASADVDLRLSDGNIVFSTGLEKTFAPYKTAVWTNFNGVYSALLVEGVANAQGFLNTRQRIKVDEPWSVSFDYQTIDPHSGTYGDGFCLMLHDSGEKGTYGDAFEYKTDLSRKRINNKSAYGALIYMQSGGNDQWYSWVNTNYVYTAVTNIITKPGKGWPFSTSAVLYSPMRVTFAYDGVQNLIVRLERNGSVFAMTNHLAGADLPEKFPNGAYLGIWGKCGGNYTAALVNNFELDVNDGVDRATGFSLPLQLGTGEVNLVADGMGETTFDGDLTVVGETTLKVAVDAREGVSIGTKKLTFDLRNDNVAALKLEGTFTFGTTPIVLDFVEGFVPPKKTLIADLTGVVGDGLPLVQLGEGLPGSTRLSLVDGRLYVSATQRTVIIMR